MLRKLRANDSDGFIQYRRLYGRVIAYRLRKYGIPESDYPDILQDLDIAIFRGMPRFNRDRPGGTFRGWLLKIVENLCRVYQRTQQRTPAPHSELIESMAATTTDTDELPVLDPVELRLLLEDAVAFMTHGCQERVAIVFRLCWLEGLGNAEAARILGISQKHVRYLKTRAKKYFRRFTDIKISENSPLAAALRHYRK